MSLKLYERFKRRSSVDSQSEPGDALGSYCRMIMDRLLRHLKRVADEGNVDGWMDYVDPELTYYENKSQLKSETNAAGFDSPFESERERWVSNMEAKQEEYEERMREEGKVSAKEERMNRMETR